MVKLKILTIALILIFISSIATVSSQSTYRKEFNILTSKGAFRLVMEISGELYNYYQSKPHYLVNLNDTKMYITPYVFTEIAKLLSTVCSDDEEYVNTVLQIVHQLNYTPTDALYPVETLVKGEGDCDLFSYIAASLLISAGYEVVLVSYNKSSSLHMNLAVKLNNTPTNVRGTVYYFLVKGEKYYVCETTGDNWEDGWRVGEMPSDLIDVPYDVIILDSYETNSIGTIYSYLNEALKSSQLEATIIPFPNYIVIKGKLTPSLPNETILIYIRYNFISHFERLLGKVKTGEGGYFSYQYLPLFDGDLVSFRLSWSGNEEYKGAVVSCSFMGSQTFPIFPFYLWLPLVLLLVKKGRR